MTRDYLLVLIDFHYWARDRVLAAAEALTPGQYEQPMGNSFPSVRDTLNHIYQAEWIWYARWTGVSPTAGPSDPLPDVATLRARWSDLESSMRAFLDAAGEAGLSRVYEYRLLSGKAGSSSLWQMVAHLVNHATYHRGQVTTLLRQLGAAAPKSTDMITFFRELAAAG